MWKTIRGRERAQNDHATRVSQWLAEERLLGDPSVHLVVVECRVWEALPWGKKVIAAGKHLHLEKPPGNEWAPFRDLVEEARRKKLLLQTGYLWRWHQGLVAAIEAARNGWLGEVFMVRGTMNSDRSPEERAVEAKYRGGGLFELSGHVIDRVGRVAGPPEGSQELVAPRHERRRQTGRQQSRGLRIRQALAVISQAAKMAGAGDHRSFEILGTDGTFLVHPGVDTATDARSPAQSRKARTRPDRSRSTCRRSRDSSLTSPNWRARSRPVNR